MGPVPWRVGTVTVHVHPEHADQARAYFDAVATHGRRVMAMILGLAAVQVLCVPLALGERISEGTLGLALGGSVFLMGVVVLRYPFCTPETIQIFGARRSVGIARGLGCLLLGLGVALPLLFSPA